MKLIDWLTFLSLVVFPFGVLARIPIKIVNIPEINLYILDLLVGLTAVYYLISSKHRLKLKQAVPLLIFLTIAAISLFLSSFSLTWAQTSTAFLYLLRFSAYALLLLNTQPVEKKYQLLAAVGIFTAVFGFIQYIFWPDLRVLKYIDWDPHYRRLAGTFLDPNFCGIILVLTLIILYKLYQKNRYYLPGLIFCLIALVLTYSRSSYLALAAAVVIHALKNKSLRLLTVFLPIFFIFLLLIPKGDGEGLKLARISTVYSRLNNWNEGITIGHQHPLFGVGFNAYRYYRTDTSSMLPEKSVNHAGAGVDSSLLFVFATTGLLGLFFYCFFLIKIFRHNRNTTALASLAALLIHSLFVNSLFFPWVMFWWFNLFSLGESHR